MNKTVLRSVAALALFAGLTGCGENAWNNHLEGFEVPPVSSATESINYTLTAADYSTISGLAANKTLAGTSGQAALTAIGKNACFASEEEARLYLPAFLENPGFAYFVANNGSSVKVTYNVAEILPADINEAAGAVEYRVTQAQYQTAWESNENYVEAFAPMNPAASHLPAILKSAFPDATQGQMVVANYNQATTNPIFGTVEGGGQEWTPTSVIKNVAVGDELDIRGIVTGISTRGFVVTDQAGSICYDQGNGFSDDAITIGAMVNVKGGVTAYSRCLQITADASYEVVGTENYSYPTPTLYTTAMIEEACNATGDMLAQYVKLTGNISVSGNYVNLSFEGTEQLGSVYNAPDYVKALLKDGEQATLEGYFVAVTGKAKYFNLLVTSVNGTKPSASKSRSAETRSAVGTLETVAMNAIYTFNGSKWVVPSNTVVLQPSDYAAMDQKYGNLSGTLPETLLPKYMQATFPYAAEGDMMTVVYKYYDGAKTSFRANGMVVTNGQWVINDFHTEATDQFNKLNNKWQFDPSVKMTLPAGRGQAFSATYYQACVDWVYKNIDVPLGSTDIKSGVGYVTTYGNNEYYSGASAYQNNVDLRASAALAQYAAGYAGKTDAEIVELMKYHFCYEVFPGALTAINGDAKPVEGIDVLFTVTFSAYTGTSTDEYTGIWKVVGPGKFQFVSCNWWSDGVSPLAK